MTINNEWLYGLIQEFPDRAEELRALGARRLTKEEKLAKFIRFCAAHPRLPMMWMYEEYDSALNVVERECTQPEVRPSKGRLSAKQVIGLRRRQQNYLAMCEAAAELIAANPREWKVEEVASRAGVSIHTLYNHFGSLKRLLVTAYEHLIAYSDLYDLD